MNISIQTTTSLIPLNLLLLITPCQLDEIRQMAQPCVAEDLLGEAPAAFAGALAHGEGFFVGEGEGFGEAFGEFFRGGGVETCGDGQYDDVWGHEKRWSHL